MLVHIRTYIHTHVYEHKFQTKKKRTEVRSCVYASAPECAHVCVLLGLGLAKLGQSLNVGQQVIGCADLRIHSRTYVGEQCLLSHALG